MRGFALVALACGVALVAWPAQKKKKDEVTQTLQLPKELPSAVVGDTRRLTFHVTPLSSKGLLSQQVRDALKALAQEAGGDTVLKIRAFVAGSGDVRRVRDLVSEGFADRRQPLPALSLIQIRRAAARRRAGGFGGHCRRKEGSQSPRAGFLLRADGHFGEPARSGGAAGRQVPGGPAPGRPGGGFGTLRRAPRHLFPQLAGQPGGHAQAGGSRVSARRAELRGDATRAGARAGGVRGRGAARAGTPVRGCF